MNDEEVLWFYGIKLEDPFDSMALACPLDITKDPFFRFGIAPTVLFSKFPSPLVGKSLFYAPFLEFSLKLLLFNWP